MARSVKSVLLGVLMMTTSFEIKASELSLQDQIRQLNAKINQLETTIYSKPSYAKKIKKPSKNLRKPAELSNQNLQDQIYLLNAKIDQLMETVEPRASEPTPPPPLRKNFQNIAENRGNAVHIPGTNTSLKIGGYVKIDAVYDLNQFSGDSSNLPTLRLRGLDTDAQRTNTFTAHGKQTRISVASDTQTNQGQLLIYLESDFFGSSTEGGSGSFSRSDTSSLNSYNFRVRHAYGSYVFQKVHRLDIGQLWSLFYDGKSAGTTIEFNGPETTAQIRRPQIRYTRTNGPWRLSTSLESGATDYLDISPQFAGQSASGLGAGSPSPSYNSSQYRRAQSSFLGGISGDGNQSLPDVVGQLIYEAKNQGHFSLGIMGRQLKINKVTTTGPHDPPFKGTKYGYGVALGGRYYLYEKTSLFGQFNFGKGIGTYIFGLDGYGAALNAQQGIMRAQFCYGALMGFEHYWNDQWRSNFILSMAQANVAGFIPKGRTPVIGLDANNNLATLATTGYSISNKLRQFYVNILWAPVEKVELGFEYAYFRRNTINNYFGYANRFQFGAYYKF